MPHPFTALLVALASTMALVGTGVWVTGAPDTEREPAPYEGTPLASYDTSVVAIARAPFCDLIAPEAVEAVLGAEPAKETQWVDGDALGGIGVVHEYGCRLRAGRTEARAWVLAPPVTAERAGRLVRSARRESGCRATRGAPAYGEPSVALICTGPKRQSASYRGLFGDAWLSCTLATPKRLARQTLLDRAGRWCVAVAEAASR